MTSRPNDLPLTPASLHSSPLYDHFSGPVTDRDLVALGGAVCRAIRVTTAGDLVVTRPDGTNVTLPFASGETQTIQAKALVSSGSTAQGVTVYW